MEVARSTIHFADYNPRVLSDDERTHLKRGIRRFGMLGGLIVNKRTGMRVVSGHQRLSVLDELNGYPDKDYLVRVDVIDVDEKQEKEINILLNNPNAQGKWDYDALRLMVPEIDYKAAGLTDVDLSLLGISTEVEIPEPTSIDLTEVGLSDGTSLLQEPKSEEERKEHMKKVKAEVQEQATERAMNMHAYVMLTFDTFDSKVAFMERFGYDPLDKFIKGEEFDQQIERVDW